MKDFYEDFSRIHHGLVCAIVCDGFSFSRKEALLGSATKMRCLTSSIGGRSFEKRLLYSAKACKPFKTESRTTMR